VTLPDSTLFTAAIADHRFRIALAIAVMAGLVRGFSGFGSAQIYIPLIAAVYSPRMAAVSLLLIDTAGAAPFAVRAFWHCSWREVLPMYLAAAIAIPFGARALVIIDPVGLRWFIAFLVLTFVLILVTGWRYHGRPSLLITIGVGLFSGFGAGAVQIAGPPVLMYWLGTVNKVLTVRANFLVYFLLLGLTSCAVYIWNGLITAEALVLSLLLALPFFLATSAGARYFHGASELLYRRIAYAIIAAAALISLPVFDSVFR
jgi:uncharacterized protein